MKTILFFMLLFLFAIANAQSFYFGADLSYVNEMEDCGVVYKENNIPKDPYQIFGDHNCNLVRLRLWHTPAWYDNLNSGNRYSDLEDVKISIQRAKSAGINVLLDFHLSDTWADPGNQVVPAAWSNVVNDLEILKDSLYNYIHQTLSDLQQDNLLPEMVQIGNETNKGILLSQAVNDAGWTMDWTRNSELFNAAIMAVRDVETNAGQPIQIGIHIADPADVDWYIGNFISNGVTDFDFIGVSYYDQWHGSTNFTQITNFVASFILNFNKEVLFVETGYPWTTLWDDNAANILSSAHPGYSPLSPSNQKQWLIDLTQAVIDGGGKGVIYWEPGWVSSSCSTQWAEGSHYENATFFDFQHNLIADGGIGWMEETLVAVSTPPEEALVEVDLLENQRVLKIALQDKFDQGDMFVSLSGTDGRIFLREHLNGGQHEYYLPLPKLAPGIYAISISGNGQLFRAVKVAIVQQ